MARKSYAPASTRIAAVVGHRSSGKTSLGDILLKAAGVTRTVGRVDDATSLLDYHNSERRRKRSLGSSFAWLEWKGTLLNLVDTPGGEELVHERELAITATDGVVVVVSTPDGVEVGTFEALECAARHRKARVVVLNKVDRAHDATAVLAELEREADLRTVPLQIPYFDDDGRFTGVICLQTEALIRYAADGSGRSTSEAVPPRFAAQVQEAWDRVMEAVAVTDDDLLEEYLEYLELPVDKVQAGLSRAVQDGSLVPVLYGSAGAVIGADPILDVLCWALPSPVEHRVQVQDADGAPVVVGPDGPLVAQLVATCLDASGRPFHAIRVWTGDAARRRPWVNGRTGAVCKVHKLYQTRGPRRTTAFTSGPGALVTTWERLEGLPGSTWTDGPRLTLPVPPAPEPMMSHVLVPKGRRDAHRLPAALEEISRLDAALRVGTEELTGQPLLSGITEGHLELAVERLSEHFGVAVEGRLPPVGYRETPVAAALGVEGLHRRTNGDEVSEYGRCELDMTPQAPDLPTRVLQLADDDDLPRRFHPCIEEGVLAALSRGPTAGYPVVGVGVRCTGGAYDILYSTEDHLRIAGERALRTALERAGTRLLEPWCDVQVHTPSDEVGSVMSELSTSRGRIQGLEVEGADTCIHATVPFRELRTFAPRLLALTAGRGRFTCHRTHYEVLPAHLVAEAIHSSPFQEADRGGLASGSGTPTGAQRHH